MNPRIRESKSDFALQILQDKALELKKNPKPNRTTRKENLPCRYKSCMCVAEIKIKLKYNLSKYFSASSKYFVAIFVQIFRNHFYVPFEYLFHAVYAQIFKQILFFFFFKWYILLSLLSTPTLQLVEIMVIIKISILVTWWWQWLWKWLFFWNRYYDLFFVNKYLTNILEIFEKYF